MELNMTNEATDNDYYQSGRPMANANDHEYEDVSDTETDNYYYQGGSRSRATDNE